MIAPSFSMETYEEFLTFKKLIKEDPQVSQYLVKLTPITKYN